MRIAASASSASRARNALTSRRWHISDSARCARRARRCCGTRAGCRSRRAWPRPAAGCRAASRMIRWNASLAIDSGRSRVAELLEPLDVVGASIRVRGERGGVRLEQRAHFVEVEQVVAVEGADHRAAVGLDLDQALRLELQQRLADRRAATCRSAARAPRPAAARPASARPRGSPPPADRAPVAGAILHTKPRLLASRKPRSGGLHAISARVRLRGAVQGSCSGSSARAGGRLGSALDGPAAAPRSSPGPVIVDLRHGTHGGRSRLGRGLGVAARDGDRLLAPARSAGDQDRGQRAARAGAAGSAGGTASAAGRVGLRDARDAAAVLVRRAGRRRRPACRRCRRRRRRRGAGRRSRRAAPRRGRCAPLPRGRRRAAVRAAPPCAGRSSSASGRRRAQPPPLASERSRFRPVRSSRATRLTRDVERLRDRGARPRRGRPDARPRGSTRRCALERSSRHPLACATVSRSLRSRWRRCAARGARAAARRRGARVRARTTRRAAARRRSRPRRGRARDRTTGRRRRRRRADDPAEDDDRAARRDRRAATTQPPPPRRREPPARRRAAARHPPERPPPPPRRRRGRAAPARSAPAPGRSAPGPAPARSAPGPAPAPSAPEPADLRRRHRAIARTPGPRPRPPPHPPASCPGFSTHELIPLSILAKPERRRPSGRQEPCRAPRPSGKRSGEAARSASSISSSVTISGGRKRSVVAPVALMISLLLEQRALGDVRRLGVDLGGDHQPAAAGGDDARAARAGRSSSRSPRSRTRGQERLVVDDVQHGVRRDATRPGPPAKVEPWSPGASTSGQLLAR